jgi:CubicO group peptidase (beta-lactamase class C family)
VSDANGQSSVWEIGLGRCALLVIGLLLLPEEPASAEPSQEIGELRTSVARSLERARVRGASVALIREGEVVWIEAFGVKDERNGEPVTPHTVFEAASLGKVVAAYAALILVEDGRWSLEMPARSTRLDLEPDCEAPRLVELLAHTAGLSNNLLASRFGPACHPPAPFSYAGQGYLVLQDAIETETGEPVEQFMQKQVFRPLGMDRSTYAWPTTADRATGHVDLVYGTLTLSAGGSALTLAIASALLVIVLCIAASRRIWRRGTPRRALALIALSWALALGALVGAGSLALVPVESMMRRVLLPASLHSSVEDLARFTQELLDPRLMRDETRDLLWVPRVDAGPGLAWGTGIGIDRSTQPTTYWQWGSNPGFQSLLVLEPQGRNAIIVLTNTGGFLDFLSARTGGYNAAKQIARRALGIQGQWDLRSP